MPDGTGGGAPVLRGGWPVLGLLPALRRDPLAVFARARPLGPVVRLPVPGRHPLFAVTDPAATRHVLQENARNYRRTPFHDRLKAVLGEGLLTSDGGLWQQQRRLLQPAFRAERIRRFVAAMADSAAAMAARWEAAAGEVLDVSQEMSALTLDIAVRCMFGQEPRGGDAAIAEAVQEAQDWIAARFWSLAPDWTERLPTPRNRRFRRARAALDGLVDRIIQARLAAGETGDDLLGMLLAAQASDGAALDARQVRDEAMTMLLAGHETSAGTLAWCWHLLAKHPEVAAAMRAEIAGVLGDRRLPAPEDLQRLDLVRAVVEETLRLFPAAAWFGRLAAGPDRVAGCDIPAGSILALSPWLLQRDPRYWPDPLRFDPARFAPGMRPLPYSQFPFGGGPRTCIGNHFALTEMLVALAVLLPRVALRHASAAPVVPELLITLKPAGGLPMRVERAGAEGRHATPNAVSP
ncbi:cytochrome P450 [Paracraurococcus ruber]|nr:cytochrome P450 [Paracraurococcus ruber]